MDIPHMKERSYKIVNTMRLKNQRETRLLHDRLYSKQGLRAAYISEIEAVTREQERIRRDLANVRMTITTTWGILPGRGHSPDTKNGPPNISKQLDMDFILNGLVTGGKRRKKKRPERQHSEEEVHEVPRTPPTEVQKLMEEEPLEKEEEHNKTSVRLPPVAGAVEQPVNNIKVLPESRVQDANTLLPDITAERKRVSSPESQKDEPTKASRMKPKMTQRPKLTPIDEHGLDLDSLEDRTRVTSPVPLMDNDDTISEPASFTSTTSRQSRMRKSKRRKDPDVHDGPQFDAEKYNADGTIRTMHIMPAMSVRVVEARKARYIRHRTKPFNEQELSINDMLADIRSNRDNTRMAYSVRTR